MNKEWCTLFIEKGHETWSVQSVIGFYFCFIDICWLRYLFIFYNEHFFKITINVAPPKRNQVPRYTPTPP